MANIAIGNELLLRKLFEYTAVALPAGEVTAIWYFELPSGFIIERLEASAESADGTDYMTVNLRSGTTDLYTVVVNDAETIHTDKVPAADNPSFYEKSTVLNVELIPSGTSENVLSPHVVVWGKSKPR